MELVSAATAKMGVTETAAALATSGLSDAQKIQILRLKGKLRLMDYLQQSNLTHSLR